MVIRIDDDNTYNVLRIIKINSVDEEFIKRLQKNGAIIVKNDQNWFICEKIEEAAFSEIDKKT